MAAIHPRVQWEAREVEWTWLPAKADEVVDTARRVVSEALGMLGFTFLAGGALLINSVTDGGLGLLGMAAATGLAYALMVYMFHQVSGAHINPAVTIGELFAQRLPPSMAALYVGAQAGGAVLGALLLEVIFRDFVADASGVAALTFSDEITRWTGGLLEGVLTFMLVVAYFRGFVDRRRNPALGAFAVGLVVAVGFLVAFPLTGAALNVTRVFGTALVANEWTAFFWYWIGLIGGAVAGLFYEYLFASRGDEHAKAEA